MKTFLNVLGHIIAISIIVAATFVFSYHFAVWTPYPQGNDSVSHIFRAQIVQEYFPNVSWVHVWSSGMPLYLVYPILPYLVVAAISSGFSISLALSLQLVAILAIAVVGISVYFIVRTLTKNNWFLAVAAGFIYPASIGVYGPSFSGGTYARGIGISFLAVTLVFVTCYLKRRHEGKKANTYYVLFVIFLALTILSHHMIAAFAVGFVLPLLVLSEKGIKKRILLLLKVFLPVFFLVSFYVIGIIVYPQYHPPIDSGFWQRVKENSVPVSNILYFWPKGIGLANRAARFMNPPAAGPLALILGILALVIKWKESILLRQVIIWMLLLFVLALTYSQVWIKLTLPYNLLGSPVEMFPYFPIIFAILIGIGGYLLLGRWAASVLAVLIIVGLSLWIPKEYPLKENDSYQEHKWVIPIDLEKEQRPLLSSIFDPNPDDFNFRFGNDDDGELGQSFNIFYFNIPQTRGYFSSGILGFDYFIYFYQSLWDWVDNYFEVNFNMDWWAVRHFSAPYKTKAGKSFKYKNQKDYEFLGTEREADYFTLRQASPVISMNKKAATVLIVGKDRMTYDSLFRALAQADWNSKYFIPVRSDKRIDSLSLSELKLFDVVYLNNYDVKKSQTQEKLKQYVEKGGGLIVESNKYLNEEKVFGEILPVSGIDYQNFGTSWNLDLSDDFPEIDTSVFGPAIFDNQPWNMGIAKTPKEKAVVLVSNYEKSLIVGENLSKGRIIWSGMNLAYHIDTYKNPEESNLLAELLYWADGSTSSLDFARDDPELVEGSLTINGRQILQPEEVEGEYTTKNVYETADYKAEFLNPEKWKVTLKTPAKGIVFKEAYFFDWTAKGKFEGKWRRLPIYKAGPQFMYIPFGESFPSEVIIDFRRSPIEKLSFILAIFTLISLVWYAANGKRSRLKPFFSVKHLAKWWAKEDEE